MLILTFEERIPHSGFARRRNIDPSARRLKAIVAEEVLEEKIFDLETATAPEKAASTEESSDRAFVETLESEVLPKRGISFRTHAVLLHVLLAFRLERRTWSESRARHRRVSAVHWEEKNEE